MAGTVLVIMLFGVAMLAIWPLSNRSARIRRNLRAAYQEDAFPYALRSAIPFMPLWGTTAVAFGLLGVIPVAVARFASVAVLTGFLGVFVASYRAPLLVAPSWLRRDIEHGLIAVAVPSKLDWALFWLVVSIGVAGCIAIGLLALGDVK